MTVKGSVFPVLSPPTAKKKGRIAEMGGSKWLSYLTFRPFCKNSYE